MRRVIVGVATLCMAGSALAIPPATDQYLVSVGRIQGQCISGVCAEFRTDVWIFNPSTNQAAVTLAFLPRGSSNANPAATASVNVPAGATVELDDVFQNAQGFVNLDSVVGAFHVTSSVGVVVTSRIYDANVDVVGKGTGSAGQNYNGLPTQLAVGTGQSVSIVGTAEVPNVWRSNLQVAETSGNSVTFLIERIDSTGVTQGSDTETIGPNGVLQFNSVISSKLGAASATNQRIRVTPQTGNGRILVTASRIDSVSGDPFTIEMTTPLLGASNSTGLFDGTVLTPDGSAIDGGIHFNLASSGFLEAATTTGLPCGADSYTVDFDVPGSPLATLNPDGTFTIVVSGQTYSDGTNGFTIDWTITGALSATGVLQGQLQSVTSAGTGPYATCDGTVSRDWKAGWTGTQ